mmetsp:Transcript_25383/g.53125  ORF Transcript_25383/g.53125 Transcript_25383/m.53125 type:complete len:83 (+) Transcript_25383:1280-1528(+)
MMPSFMTFSKNAMSSLDIGCTSSVGLVPSEYAKDHLRRPSHANGELLFPPEAIFQSTDKYFMRDVLTIEHSAIGGPMAQGKI